MDVVVDILWSQLYRTERALVTLLENNGFSVLKSTSWSDGKELNLILLELEQSTLPKSKRHFGPPISKRVESESFLSKHLRNKRTASGPWIDGDRWVIQRDRDETSAIELLQRALKSGGRNVGVASEPARNLRKHVEILSGASLGKLIAKNPEFSRTMNSFLSGRPSWLA
jgi:tRNA nucleotidyltransferase (CCA-adding enzyme)